MLDHSTCRAFLCCLIFCYSYFAIHHALQPLWSLWCLHLNPHAVIYKGFTVLLGFMTCGLQSDWLSSQYQMLIIIAMLAFVLLTLQNVGIIAGLCRLHSFDKLCVLSNRVNPDPYQCEYFGNIRHVFFDVLHSQCSTTVILICPYQM